jgi:hypothetical protein
MNITLKYGNERVGGFNELLDHYPVNQFNAPRRATVPLLAYWKDRERCLDFLFHLDIQAPESLALAFEYEVPVQAGKGPPSCTDLMILGERLVVAVEAKYTESEYETVRQWLRKPNGENRRTVLQGWLALINATAGSQLTYSDVLDIAYQAIQRTASACFPHQGEAGISRFVAYQMFEDADKKVKKVVNDLAFLGKAIPPEKLQFACLVIEVAKRDVFTALEERWNLKRVQLLRDDVIEGLRQDSLFEFSRPVICSTGA